MQHGSSPRTGGLSSRDGGREGGGRLAPVRLRRRRQQQRQSRKRDDGARRRVAALGRPPRPSRGGGGTLDRKGGGAGGGGRPPPRDGAYSCPRPGTRARRFGAAPEASPLPPAVVFGAREQRRREGDIGGRAATQGRRGVRAARPCSPPGGQVRRRRIGSRRSARGRNIAARRYAGRAVPGPPPFCLPPGRTLRRAEGVRSDPVPVWVREVVRGNGG
mmetsp:Transcript_29221/g.86523  ORF Transcript_29221/g.86523 Transcript_29221/m.86523 type:complete len:217 (+) Transcript_29221:1661-2311(+)